MKRKTLSQYLREGAATGQFDDVCRGGYYGVMEHPEIGNLWFLDPIMLIFVGKFGSDVLASIGKEHRFETYTEARVWDREHVTERLTKAVNGGVWELHRRLNEHPQLYDAIYRLGFRAPRKYTSVFRAITYLSDTHRYSPEQIAAVLEEARL
jgi:hypothetical protein